MSEASVAMDAFIDVANVLKGDTYCDLLVYCMCPHLDLHRDSTFAV